jgi:mannose-1-phosphate guanylyltransferase
VGRNTAPAIALAAIKAVADANVSSSQEEPVLLVLAADHVIEDIEAFQQCVKALLPEVQAGKFGTLGIVPSEAATGYGCIKSAVSSKATNVVTEFVEKPDSETAAKYVADGYLWNSGMFLIRADRYLEELKNCCADIYDACVKSMANTQDDLDFVRIDKEAFEACPDESIDYAVMEPLAVKGQVIVAVTWAVGLHCGKLLIKILREMLLLDKIKRILFCRAPKTVMFMAVRAMDNQDV